jgi:acetolactate synthase regulatory subunit
MLSATAAPAPRPAAACDPRPAGETPRTPSDAPTLDHYVVSADADPGLMPRVLQLIAKRGLVPSECHAFTRRGNEAGGQARMTIEFKVAGLERVAAAHVAACLRQLFGVDSVLHLTERPGVG